MSLPAAVAIMGPTASGKTDLAEHLAGRLDCRIVNADAFQVYRGVDIGTAKPDERGRYELLDILDPREPFTAGRFVELARGICGQEAVAGRHCLVVGGTGLYVRALFDEYTEMQPGDHDTREELQRRLEDQGAEALLQDEGVPREEVLDDTFRNPVRLIRMLEKRRLGFRQPKLLAPWPARRIKVGLMMPRDVLWERIEKRLHAMVQNGWADETAHLLEMGASSEWPSFRAIGYADMAECVRGRLSLEDALQRILVRIRQYAKKQMTWLRKEPGLIWLDGEQPVGEIAMRVENLIREGNTNSG